MVQAGAVREGMTVRTSDGRKVGRVAAVGDIHFELEQGLVPIPRKDYLVEYRDVDFVKADVVFLVQADHPLLHLEVDDDGGALPPRHSRGMDTEPVNASSLPDVEPARH
ncbi:DUF2171 domain-containing protein [Myxococcus sp. K15C18031901]|uniref:PRC-barrel domain-containing protein n=1 Tax=Myxococcus dinghuensis TaxID=2906761 RepID=UPI0020A7F805|nr:DUF2171 domain-containing protein [Myxococcus dinghuensis]MCP3102635.1 DUF2171 domain-containing protein [Myxococcus dinghuensis]